MICHVYFLFSEKKNQFYVGISNDVANRIKRHNNGESLSTKNGVPWKLLHILICDNKAAAMKVEMKIKKRRIARYLSDNNMLPDNSVPL